MKASRRNAPATAARSSEFVMREGEPELTRWRGFVGRLPPVREPLSDVILSSWRRSAAVGLRRTGDVRFRRITDAELETVLAANRELLEVAKPHLDWISAFMAEIPHVVYLTDGNGIVLESIGDLAHSDELHLSPGHDWSEKTMGTNGAGTAIAADRPVAVVGSEHFVTAFENCTCTGAPIHRNGKVIGAIDVSTSVEDATPDRLALVAHAAFVIDRELALVHASRRQEHYRNMADALRVQERELRETNAQLEALLDNTAAIIYIVDASTRLLRTNRRWEELFGVSGAEILGRPLEQLLGTQTAERFVENNRRVLEARRSLEFEEEVTIDGICRTYLSIKVPMFDAAGSPYAICGISTDITDRKAGEQRERRILEEANARKERFITALAHELRSPISAIMAAGELLEQAPADPAEVATCGGIVSRQAAHVASLVEQLLEASRAAKQRLTLTRSRLDVREALAQAIEAVRPSIDTKRQVLCPPSCAEPVIVAGDLTRLTQVFVNLLDNASRCTEEGRTIWVTAARTGTQAVVSVRDEGCGIAPEALPKLFDLMYQAEGVSSAQGLGLGLSIVRGIVEAHGGSVVARSDGIGRGSEFVVTIPCVE